MMMNQYDLLNQLRNRKNDFVPQSLIKKYGEDNIRVTLEKYSNESRNFFNLVISNHEKIPQKTLYLYFDNINEALQNDITHSDTEYHYPIIQYQFIPFDDKQWHEILIQVNICERRAGVGRTLQNNINNIVKGLEFDYITTEYDRDDNMLFWMQDGRYLFEEMKQKCQKEMKHAIQKSQKDYTSIKFLHNGSQSIKESVAKMPLMQRLNMHSIK